ncbi:hypothetical protein PHJA_001932700 [Phtheirospermum japonicum]|uniref:Uncharacterized protein n=1 Tax=Phtheirospermum japonicum TaxID=374723 RepID=A0A830CFB3_9LAMI|nr:hypothetical protein PHJA_001932700 [Phtheirospermum japonicum]
MASACVNDIGIPPESFLDCPPVKCPPYGWLNPRFSLSREYPDEEGSTAPSSKPSAINQAKPNNADEDKPEISDPEISGNSFIDFEFRLVDPVAMLTADELFSDGKLVPLHLSTIRRSMVSHPASSETRSEHAPEFRRRIEISSTDPYLYSPKAPSCTARWKEILGLKKLYQNGNGNKQDGHKTTSSPSKGAARSLKQFLPHRGGRCDSSSLNLPLLKEPDNESQSISSRLSLSSSSSSGHEHDDLPRLSLDSDKPTRSTQHVTSNLSKIRVAKHRSTENQTAASRGVSVDSPRMNSSGKIVFHGLERSSSSPSAFNGGPRPYKSRGMERSYSANVRVTPVLNVPVCTLRGSSKSGVFGLFSTQHKKDGCNTVGANRIQLHHVKNRTDRT